MDFVNNLTEKKLKKAIKRHFPFEMSVLRLFKCRFPRFVFFEIKSEDTTADGSECYPYY